MWSTERSTPFEALKAKALQARDEYVAALQAKDTAIINACQTASIDLDAAYEDACTELEKKRFVYDALIQQLNAVRREK